MTRPKVPATAPAALEVNFASAHVHFFRSTLWRIFATEGPHAQAWNKLRHFGPLPDMRFDPHPDPKGLHEVGVM